MLIVGVIRKVRRRETIPCHQDEWITAIEKLFVGDNYTRIDFDRDFPTDNACLEWLKNNRWPDGIYCKKCERVTKHYRIKTRPVYSCGCGSSPVHPMVGTIFEDTRFDHLRLWFYAMFLMASPQYSISVRQLQHDLGVTHKTAWRMLKYIQSTRKP